MFVPYNDDRYFTSGADNDILQEITLYEPTMYEAAYPRISSTMPQMFSVNLRSELGEFLSKAPPQFEVSVAHVVELACYYYCDWDSVVAVTDEFIQAEVISKVRNSLIQAHYDVVVADNMLQDFIVMLSEALRRFIGIVIGVLSRTGAPAIMDYGCCYRLYNVDKLGNVFFELRNPSQVYAEIEGEEAHDRQHRSKF